MTAQIAIVPAYNEAASISAVVAELGEHAPGFDVVVIDDGSTDDTAERARAAGADVVRHPFNLGIGGAGRPGAPGRVVGRAVVDHDNVELRIELTQLGDDSGDGVLLVPRRNDREAAAVRHGRPPER